jgi:hypothetical protein
MKQTLIICLIALFATASSAEHNVQADSITLFDYFFSYEGEPVIKLNTKVNQLMRKKLKEEEQEGTFAFTDKDGNEVMFEIDVRTRGNMRKQVCNLPPLKVDFGKKDLREAGFVGKVDDLKLVLQCKTADYAKNQLLREHLIYELYEPLDPHHIRTKRIQIELWEDDKLRETLQGLIVEDESQIEHRMSARVVENPNIRSGSIQREQYLKMAFFQFMILNTDWTVANQHNVEIIKVPDIPRVLAIPYDFDYAGLVGTSYAVPHESLPIKEVSERYFMGFQVTEEEAMRTAEFFKGMEDTFHQIVDSRTYLQDDDKREVKEHIDDFYQILESDKLIKRYFVTM